MNVLVLVPIALPLLGAALSAITRRPVVGRAISLVTITVALGASIAMFVAVERDGPTVVRIGGWPERIGIALQADLLATLLLTVSLATMLAVLVFAVGHPRTREAETTFHPAFLVTAAGVAQAFLTADLFNLFVAFEILLIASAVLLTMQSRRDQVRSGMTYTVIGVVASVLFLIVLGLVYLAAGTVNLSDLARVWPELPGGTRSAIGLLLFAVFGIKAGVFPLFFWLPDSYPTAPSPVTAVLAGLLTKVGVASMLRTHNLLVPDGRPSSLLLGVAAVTMLVGVLGAIAQHEIKRILSFHIVSQIGYMVLGVALGTTAAIAATILFLVHQIPVKTALFLVEGIVEHDHGTGRLEEIEGVVHHRRIAAVCFALAALSLAGIPPLSGFVGKLALVRVAIDEHAWVPLAVALGASLLTLFSMTKIWNGVFWGRPDGVDGAAVAAGPDRTGALREPVRVMHGATVALVVLTLAIAVAAGPITSWCTRAAEHLAITGAVRP